MTRIELPERPRILVVALRRLGDVLLTTPLIASLRKAWPDATIEALVFADTAGILAGNPDLDGVVTMPARRTFAQSLSLAMKLGRRYDLAVSTQSGDRPTFFAILAARHVVAPVEARASGAFKSRFLARAVPVAAGVHRVEDMLRLADTLGIERVPRLVPPAALPFEPRPSSAYAVIHAAPMFRYKQWTAQGWRAVAASLKARGLTVIATGGPAADERAYLDDIWQGTDVLRFDGKLSWGQLSGLLADAKVFIGPDTSVTHLAAACGCPTVALFGPTDPRLWGPWPVGGLSDMWADIGAVQQRGNVWLVQRAFPCTPCQLEGCERKLESYSACLDALAPQQVMTAIDEALGPLGR
ncbi:glycosyltransferase family 9 protein [Undibacter mobilis]|uniref:Glycosyltransferase family 9 protein n=1 Tax=Undibacter mobilis TaxID=2292256 RepID=A0A371BBY2_9BRAD|nr:glycosyltransferase family 9 protein [Undibacter mobilis]RDV05109.1 glycosyltransferase family 9 protein [Undibacter mobilis]